MKNYIVIFILFVLFLLSSEEMILKFRSMTSQGRKVIVEQAAEVAAEAKVREEESRNSDTKVEVAKTKAKEIEVKSAEEFARIRSSFIERYPKLIGELSDVTENEKYWMVFDIYNGSFGDNGIYAWIKAYRQSDVRRTAFYRAKIDISSFPTVTMELKESEFKRAFPKYADAPIDGSISGLEGSISWLAGSNIVQQISFERSNKKFLLKLFNYPSQEIANKFIGNWKGKVGDFFYNLKIKKSELNFDIDVGRRNRVSTFVVQTIGSLGEFITSESIYINFYSNRDGMPPKLRAQITPNGEMLVLDYNASSISPPVGMLQRIK